MPSRPGVQAIQRSGVRRDFSNRPESFRVTSRCAPNQLYEPHGTASNLVVRRDHPKSAPKETTYKGIPSLNLLD